MHINDQYSIEYYRNKALFENYRMMNRLEDAEVHDRMFQAEEDIRALVVFV